MHNVYLHHIITLFTLKNCFHCCPLFIFSFILKFTLFSAVLGLRCWAGSFLQLWRVESTLPLRHSASSLQWPLLLPSTGCAGLAGSVAQHVGSVAAALEQGLVVAAHGLSWSTACGILQGQELNPWFPYQQADPLPLNHQGSPTLSTLNQCKSINYSSKKWENN